MPLARRRSPRARVALLATATVLASWAVAAAAPPPASGRETAVHELDAAPLLETSALRLDGELTEDVWQQAPSVRGFLQREPNEGAAATFDTEARVAYDGTCLYVAVRATDPEPGRLVGILTRRDATSPSDWIRVFVDSFHDRRTAFEFAVNPSGVKQDRYWFDDTNNDPGWDAVWDVAVKVDGTGWQAEFRIPFSQLRFKREAGGAIGFAVAREIGRLKESSSWPLLPRSANGFVSSFGELKGVNVGKTLRRLELVPYSVGHLDTLPSDPGNPFANTVDPGGSLGLDLKYALSPGLTLTGTINPDFGQVEADPAVVNLSAFETFFPERRPFFLEQSGIFRFDTDCEDDQCTGLFYSRRIGRSPQAEVDVADDGFVDEPAQTTILGAAKLTGKVGAFSVGALNALTGDETAHVAAPDGTVLPDQAVEPFTSYTVVRARREFANQSTVGFITTATNRKLTGGLTDVLANEAYTGGVDVDWRLSKRYKIAGYWAGSTVRGDPAAIETIQSDARHLYQRPDADYVELDPSRTSLNGDAGMLSLQKNGGERVRFTTIGGWKSPGFEINDVGYLRRADQRWMSNWLQLRRDKPTRHLRTYRINFNQWAAWNYGGDRLYSGVNVNMHWQFANSWQSGFGTNLNAQGFDDHATRGGPGAYTNPRVNGWFYTETDDRRRASAGFQGFLLTDRKDSSVVDLNPSVQYRPTSALTMSAGLGLTHNVDDAQWIENLTVDGRDRYVFGHLDQTTVGIRMRVNYTMSPTLSLQIYAEPFVSSGAYTGFKELVDGRAAKYEDRYAPYAYASNPDFRYTSFRTTNVLRWEYRPGSTLFVVWQQGREQSDERADFQFGRDFGHIFTAPGKNVFLVKLAYWLNM